MRYVLLTGVVVVMLSAIGLSLASAGQNCQGYWVGKTWIYRCN